jgi:hypothetical protein
VLDGQLWYVPTQDVFHQGMPVDLYKTAAPAAPYGVLVGVFSSAKANPHNTNKHCPIRSDDM